MKILRFVNTGKLRFGDVLPCAFIQGYDRLAAEKNEEEVARATYLARGLSDPARQNKIRKYLPPVLPSMETWVAADDYYRKWVENVQAPPST